MRVSRVRSLRRRATALSALVAAAVITMAGCSSGSASSSSDSGLAAPGVAAADAAPARDAAGAPEPAATGAAVASAVPSAGDAAASAPRAGGLGTLPVDGSKVIRTADLSVRLVVPPVPATDDAAADRAANAAARSATVAQAAGSIRGIATAAGGFQSSADGGGSQMAISLRVPAEQYGAVVDKVAAVGELTNRTESSRDVTADVVDVKSRVESMTASVARVRALLAQATTIADVIAIESELSVREANLESLQQQQAYLDGQVALSTVSVTLHAVTDGAGTDQPTAPDTGFVAGLRGGWAALLGFLGWIGGAVGAVLPFLPLIAIAGLLLWWVIRRIRRRGVAIAPVTPVPPVPTVPPQGGTAAGGGQPEDAAQQSVGVGSS